MERLLGVAAAVGASIAWALNPAFFRVGTRGVDAATFNALRVLSALPFLAALVVGVEGLELPSALEAWLYIAAASIIGVGLGDALYIEASKRIGGGRAVTIGYLYIFASQLLAHALLGEELGMRMALGTLAALTGLWLVATEGDERGRDPLGVAAALGSALAWGFGSIANKLALGYVDPLRLSLLRSVVLAALLTPARWRGLLCAAERRITLVTGVASGVLSFAVGLPLFLLAIDTLGVGAAVLATALTPVLGRVAARALAGERISARGVAGTLLTSAGIALGLG